MVFCPRCQHDSSDPLFCERCNGLLPSGSPAALPAAVTLRDGRVVACDGWGGAWPIDCWRPLVLDGVAPCRLYALNPGWWRELAGPVERRAAVALPCLSAIEVLPHAGGALVVAHAQADADRPLVAVATEGDEMERLEGALAALRTLVGVLAPLHDAGLVWLNFEPHALEVGPAGPCLSNLDLLLYRAGACPDSIRISAAYSPPEVCRFRADRIGPATDVFHVSIYLYYRLAGLLPAGFPGRGLEAFDFEIPPLRVYHPRLPPGIVPVLQRGLARDPAQRFTSLPDLLDAFACAVARARERSAARAPVSREHGSASVIGRSHELTGLPNQDAHVVMPLGPDRLLAVVADGVTHALIGSGEVASQAAVEVLACALPTLLDGAEPEQHVDDALAEACVQASRTILELALAVAPPGEVNPVDMMSSTAVIGLVQGNLLTLAGSGDSRAYLIADGHAEQLTVDGDVRCIHLANGVPPEEVRDLGLDALALYTCLGVGEEVAGEPGLAVCLPRTLPHVSRWRLLPGDVVVLCSDGLVEEGVFLEPADLAALAATPDLSASDLACRLVQAARARHRDASPWEPAGCGDDATCVVLVIGPGPAE
jgi:serine/threonine protein phosphatase PrpC